MKPYYDHNGITIYHGDCLEVMKDIPDQSIDMVLADPPYGTTACKWDSVIPFDAMWERLNKLIKPNGAIVLFGSEPFSSALRMSNIKNYKYDWIWEKERGTGFARANKQPLRKHEIISVFYKKPPFYNPEGDKLEKPYKHALPISKSKSDNVSGSGFNSEGNRIYKTYTHSKKHSIIKISREHNTKNTHPTQKPVALMEYLIKTYTNEGETVLDFAMGSGTTGVACQKEGRKAIGIENEEKYCEIAAKRLAQEVLF